MTVSFVQPQTPGGVDAYSYRLPTASKGCGGWENFEEGDRLVEVDGVGERREDGAERSGTELGAGGETRLTLMCRQGIHITCSPRL